MKNVNIGKMQKQIKNRLDENRYIHTLGVAYTATALAMRYDYDISKAQVAGLLHDSAKCIPNQKKIQLCEKYNIHMTELERRNPYLLHAKLGAFLSMRKFKIYDKEIISAILNHTTGKPNMSLLDKILYVADYIEPKRHQAPNLPEMRKLAFVDLDKTLYCILEDTLNYLENSGDEIDPLTRKAFEYYKEKLDSSDVQI